MSDEKPKLLQLVNVHDYITKDKLRYVLKKMPWELLRGEVYINANDLLKRLNFNEEQIGGK